MLLLSLIGFTNVVIAQFSIIPNIKIASLLIIKSGITQNFNREPMTDTYKGLFLFTLRIFQGSKGIRRWPIN